jgi:hypothetical protein
MTSPRMLFISLLRIACIMLLLGGTALKVWAVLDCSGKPPVRGFTYAWQVGSTVAVVVSNVPPSLQPCVSTGFNNWNTANTVSRVHFNVTFGSPIDPTNKRNVYQVTMGPVSGGNAGSTTGQDNGVNRTNATTNINTDQTDCTQLAATTMHEIGHTMGLGDCTLCNSPDQSVMIGGLPPYPTAISPCDIQVTNTLYPCTSVATCKGGFIWSYTECKCIAASPIVIDVDGRGFTLTDAQHGVTFDMTGIGTIARMGWTASGSTNAFLSLPGADGQIHSGRELFGNFTDQPPSHNPNGFLALAVYDQVLNGGNEDGVIDSRDAVFSSLRLWVDRNHDAISQTDELYTLLSLGVHSISLKYKESNRIDRFGNRFRYSAEINQGAPGADRRAFDIFFITQDPGNAEGELSSNARSCPLPRSEGQTLATSKR